MAQQQVQQQVSTTKREDEGVDDRPQDVRDKELSDDVACCLGEIDRVLEETEAEESAIERREREERERAKATWEALQRSVGFFSTLAERDYYSSQVMMWRAKYGHLYEWCCSNPDFNRPL
jgi:hypothetical protein